MRLHFDSSTVTPTQRTSAWCQVFSQRLYPVDVEVDSREVFRGSLGSVRLGQLEIVDVRRAAVRQSRSKPNARQLHDDVFISLLLEGTAHLQRKGGDLTQMPGDIVVWDARPTSWVTHSGTHSLVVKVPRRFVDSCSLWSRHLIPHALDRNSPVAALAGRMLHGVAQLGDLSEESPAAKRLAGSLLDVIVAGLEITLAEGKGLDKRRCTLLRAKEYMTGRLDDSELDAEAVANALGMSIRTLNRLFAAEGTTTMRWLWQERLQTSYRIILEGQAGKLSEVALACGFMNFSHFSHAFRRAFGMPPSMAAGRTEQ